MKDRDPHSHLATPKASRPFMPGYGILDADSGRGLFAVELAVERLSKSRNYWIASTWPEWAPALRTGVGSMARRRILFQ